MPDEFICPMWFDPNAMQLGRAGGGATQRLGQAGCTFGKNRTSGQIRQAYGSVLEPRPTRHPPKSRHQVQYVFLGKLFVWQFTGYKSFAHYDDSAAQAEQLR